MITFENGQVQSTERREKASHSYQDHSHEQEAGVHPGQAMIEAIRDCQVLIAGGMGQPMYNRATSSGLEVYLTGEDLISDAVEACDTPHGLKGRRLLAGASYLRGVDATTHDPASRSRDDDTLFP